MKVRQTIDLPTPSPGKEKCLTVLRFGKSNSAGKAYIQAGLHADESPGFLVAHHLETLLDKAKINGEILLVPAANPIGLSQWRDDKLAGRFHFDTSVNFNRNHYDLIDQVAEKVVNRLSKESSQNVRIIRQAMKEALAELQPEEDVAFLKKSLLSLACDADIVLDLHCDNEALLHVYLGTPLWPDASDLSAQLGVRLTLLARNSGGNPFDEACSRIWWELAEKFPDYPIPLACLAATIELRGLADTDNGTALEDAKNIYRFLQRRKIIAGEPSVLPSLKNEPAPLTGVDYVKAPAAGVIVHFKKPGDAVTKDETIAEIISPLASTDEQKIYKVKSRTDGLLFTRSADRCSHPGRIIAKIAGRQPLRKEIGKLLTS